MMGKFFIFKVAIIVLLLIATVLLTFLIASKVCRTRRARYIMELVIPLMLIIIMQRFTTWFQINNFRNWFILSGLTLIGLSLCIAINQEWNDVCQIFHKSVMNVKAHQNDTQEEWLKWIYKNQNNDKKNK